MSSITPNNRSWHCLPPEIRLMILEFLPELDDCKLSGLATVSREWQSIIEPRNFHRLKLTPLKFADFDSIMHHHQAQVHYIWFCIELQEYECNECAPPFTGGLSKTDNLLITTALQRLFSSLSAWESDRRLQLDISVYSPSDSKHWFKYLTFGPDIPPHSSTTSAWRQHQNQIMLNDITDHHHGWIDGRQGSIPPSEAIHKVFDDIMGEGPFDEDQEENEWWQHLPLVPAVTSLLLRQQNRRLWKPMALMHMFTRFPRLEEIHYEPWRDWIDGMQKWGDIRFESLFESLASRQLQRLVIFENFHEQYPIRFPGESPVRIPTFAVSRAVVKASLKLQELSASFIVDASSFFEASELEPSWKWPHLTSLALTSRVLAPNRNPIEINDMLQTAAAVAMKMPNLVTMEIWNGKEGLAMLFRYQAATRQAAVITCRGTQGFSLQPSVVQAWEAVAMKHHGQGAVFVDELLDIGAIVKSHADAIHHLELSTLVARPVSLWQIRREHEFQVVHES